MRKLKLDIDALIVESFAVDPTARSAGTVHGNVGGGPYVPIYEESYDVDCGGGGANTVGTCIGPTYCCPATWRPSCAHTCINTDCGQASCGSCNTWVCSCNETCQVVDCPP